jgi:beta-lactam-binding protein with PASTA domain
MGYGSAPNIAPNAAPNIELGAMGPHGANAATVPPVKRKGRKTLVIVISAVLVVLLVLGTAAGTYMGGLWGPRKVPDYGQWTAESSDFTADQAIRRLTDAGFKTKQHERFSGEKAGMFLNVENAKPGEWFNQTDKLVVVQSAGPGVPKGTVGSDAAAAAKTLAKMRIPVYGKQIVVSSEKQAGKVVQTLPADGKAADPSGAIYVGVGVNGGGIPVDIAGMGKDEAKTMLESQGYAVTLTPRFSSNQYVGKVASSDPIPGATLDPGSSVTLYYGVDKSAKMEILDANLDNTNEGFVQPSSTTLGLAGTYCKSTVNDSAKDCITLEKRIDTPSGAGRQSEYLQRSDVPSDTSGSNYATTNNLFNALRLCNPSQDPTSCMASSSGFNSQSSDSLPMKNHLLLKDWGMFELYSGGGAPNCGSDVFPPAYSSGVACDAGQITQDSGNLTQSSGLTYEMKDFFVYFPVGSDIAALENSGYFDAESLAQAKAQKAVDASRPFIIARDANLYTQKSIPCDWSNYSPNPFVPNNSGGKNNLVAMKPAPSDETAYYLVEDTGSVDLAGASDLTGDDYGFSAPAGE